MVKKLLKHEFRAWMRVLPLIFGITLVVSAMLRLLVAFENDSIYYEVVFNSAIFMFVVALLATMISPTIYGIVRFYKNMFSGEGYLTHTLPVTPANHLWVKLLTGVCFDIFAVLIVVLSGMIASAGELLTEIWKAAVYLVNDIPQKYVGHVLAWLAEFVVLLLVSGLGTYLLYYFCICIGQLFRKNRVLAAVGVYFALYMITQTITTVFMVMFTFMGVSGIWEDVLKWIEKNQEATVHIVLLGSLALSAIMCAIYYWICHGIIRKKLNLE